MSFQTRVRFTCWIVACSITFASVATQPLLPAFAPQPRSPMTNLYQLRSQWAYAQRAYPLGYVPVDARARALQSIQDSQAHQKPIRPLTSSGSQWVNIGPAPIVNGQIAPAGPVSGRVLCIAVDPSNPARWLIGTAQGGVWETHDTGKTWAPKTDDQASLAIGALAFSTANHSIV